MRSSASPTCRSSKRCVTAAITCRPRPCQQFWGVFPPSFVEAAGGHDLDGRAVELARAVHRRTGGNALFIGETLLHLVESGRVYLDGDRWHYDADPDHLGVPEGLREVVGRRLSRLGDDAN